jgi:tRNA pseudouridine55 synthase
MSSRPKRFFRRVDGILLLNKPLGMSSNAALQQVRVLFAALKAGHGGSLDPLASGMLPICFGQASKVCGALLTGNKTYRVLAKLGRRTSTGDAEGEVIEEKPVPVIDATTLQIFLQQFIGTQTQVPPMYSALKHHGERLYEIARRGESVERPRRTIQILHIELLSCSAEAGEFELQVTCSKGTYIRTLVEDVGAALGTVAFVGSLHRTSVEPFEPSSMQTLSGLQSLSEQGFDALDALLAPPEAALRQWPEIELDEENERKLLFGQRIQVNARPDASILCAYGPGRRFLGVVEADGDDFLRPKRLFVS